MRDHTSDVAYKHRGLRQQERMSAEGPSSPSGRPGRTGSGAGAGDLGTGQGPRNGQHGHSPSAFPRDDKHSSENLQGTGGLLP